MLTQTNPKPLLACLNRLPLENLTGKLGTKWTHPTLMNFTLLSPCIFTNSVYFIYTNWCTRTTTFVVFIIILYIIYNTNYKKVVLRVQPTLVLRPFVLRLFVLTLLANLHRFLICTTTWVSVHSPFRSDNVGHLRVSFLCSAYRRHDDTLSRNSKNMIR
jgi:hypothetical protein